MSEQISRLIRDHIKNLKPYSSARSEYSGDAALWLDANEFPGYSAYSRYPDPMQLAVRSKIANRYGLLTEQVFLGNGSDEAIDLLIRACCRPGLDNILVLQPTYGMYEVSAAINGVGVLAVPLDAAFDINVAEVVRVLDKHTRILFLCSPNNPTGNLLSKTAITALLHAFDGLVVIDEAYIDFAGPGNDHIALLSEERVVILRTFSKAWGMAGIRLGMAWAHPLLISTLLRIKQPYNISAPVQELILTALEQRLPAAAAIAALVTRRDTLATALSRLPVVRQVYPSDANFLLVQCTDADAVYACLLRAGIIVRNRSKQPGCDNCLRITVGTSEECALLLAALEQCSFQTTVS